MNIRVKRRPLAAAAARGRAPGGLLLCGAMVLPCAIGHGGICAAKREGDGATPIGAFSPRRIYYRSDRVLRPASGLPVRALRRDDGWCDATGDRNYNRPVRHPYPASAEKLWRDDQLYDLIVVLGYNDIPRVQGRGSAIFVHVCSSDWRATEGCVALPRDDLIRLAKVLSRRSCFVVQS